MPAPAGKEEIAQTCHDLRGALNSIGTALAVAEIHPDLTADLGEAIRIAVRGYGEAARLVEELTVTLNDHPPYAG